MGFSNGLVAIAATPALQALLNSLGYLKLEPLKHWAWSTEVITPITYLVAAGAAAVACLAPATANRTKIAYIVVSMVLLVAFFGAYTWASSTPPRAGMLWAYEVIAFGSFFLTYVAFGLLVARVIRYFGK